MLNVLTRLALGAIVAIAVAFPVMAGQLDGLAFVEEDGSLKVQGRTVKLFGIYIPPTNRQCRTFIRPVRCASRAVLALDFQVRRFVKCIERHRNRDRSIAATCYVGGTDLAAWMLENGWAVALPGAPFEYVTLERIARAHNRGVWGFQVDSITSPGPR